MAFFDANLLKQSSFFGSLEDDDIQELASLFTEASCPEGHFIFQFGNDGQELYLVTSGHVELFVRDHTGQKIILKIAGPGEVFGELSLLDNGPRTASAMALEACELAALNQENLFRFLRQKPQTAVDLLGVLGGQIRKTNDLVRGRVSRNTNTEVIHNFTRPQKIASTIADFSGSMKFLYLNIVFFTLWVIVNLNLIPGIPAFDPYPFGFLTMAVSLEAIFLSIFVLLAQNLQADKDRLRSDIEYEVNLKAEQEIAYLHEKVDLMSGEILLLLRQLKK